MSDQRPVFHREVQNELPGNDNPGTELVPFGTDLFVDDEQIRDDPRVVAAVDTLNELVAANDKVDGIDARLAAAEQRERLVSSLALLGPQLGSLALVLLERNVLNGPAFDPVTFVAALLGGAYGAKVMIREQKIYKQANAQLTLERYAAIDECYRAALQSMGENPTAMIVHQELPKVIEQGDKVIGPSLESRAFNAIRALIKSRFGRESEPTAFRYADEDESPEEEGFYIETPSSKHDAWLSKSKYVAEHSPAAEGMTSERMARLADDLYTIIFESADEPEAAAGFAISCWRATELPSHSIAPGEAGGMLNMTWEDLSFTLDYLTTPIDGSEAKIGLWIYDKSQDYKMWIVAEQRNGEWRYTGADRQTTLRKNRNEGVWETVEPSPEDVEKFVTLTENTLQRINSYSDEEATSK